MIDIAIDSALKDKVNTVVLGCLTATVTVTEHDEALWQEIDTHIDSLTARLRVEDISSLAQVAAQRKAYRALGKDPGRYRGAAEALLRRIAQGKGLYRVNTVVDINNLISLETAYSVGCYDRAQLQAPITFCIGAAGASYEGIGKGTINIENLPVFVDKIGPFGSPTSDSQRSLIKTSSTEILMIVISFNSADDVDKALARASALLQRYAAAQQVDTRVVV